MGEPVRGDRSDRYMEIWVWLELVKLLIWISLMWFGDGGPSCPL